MLLMVLVSIDKIFVISKAAGGKLTLDEAAHENGTDTDNFLVTVGA
jgi:hypothetical protein